MKYNNNADNIKYFQTRQIFLKLTTVIIFLFFSFLLRDGTGQPVNDLDKWHFIVKYPNGKMTFRFIASGDKGGASTVEFTFHGFYIICDMTMSYMLENNMKMERYYADWYGIYPMRLSVSCNGKADESWIEEDTSRIRKMTNAKTWSFNSSMELPPAPDSKTAVGNVFSSWQRAVDDLSKKQGLSAVVCIADQRPDGGKVYVFPNFVLHQEKLLMINTSWNGTDKNTGRTWSGSSNASVDLVFGFGSVAAGLYLQGKPSVAVPLTDFEYYYNTATVSEISSFSLDSINLSISRQVQDECMFYSRNKNRKDFTVTSDHSVAINYICEGGVSEEADAIIEKVQENYRPKGGDENNTVDVTAKFIKSGKKGKFRFTLFECSKEKGYALNKGSETDFDYKFTDNQSGFNRANKATDGWTIETTDELESAVVAVESLDYGAWAKMKAEVLVNGEWKLCKTSDGGEYITVPRDENENHIADFWEKEKKVTGQAAQADTDKEPSQIGDPSEPGDGFSNYEEYRGFFVDGTWMSTNPCEKDLFIYDELGYGTGFLSKLGLKIHLIKQNEYDDSHTVNFNRGYGTLSSQDGQKGLYLRGAALDGCAGHTFGFNGEDGVGCPNVIEEVVVDAMGQWDETEMEYKRMINNKNPKYSVEEHGAFQSMYSKALNTLISHELGHAINIMHHGWDIDPGEGALGDSDESYIKGSTATKGGLWSGDEKCVMRYDPAYNYFGWDNKYWLYPDEGASSKTDYCSSSTGTGINAPEERIGADGKPYPVAGDASYGACRKMIDLKGEHYYGDVEGIKPKKVKK